MRIRKRTSLRPTQEKGLFSGKSDHSQHRLTGNNLFLTGYVTRSLWNRAGGRIIGVCICVDEVQDGIFGQVFRYTNANRNPPTLPPESRAASSGTGISLPPSPQLLSRWFSFTRMNRRLPLASAHSPWALAVFEQRTDYFLQSIPYFSFSFRAPRDIDKLNN